jgi:hypothetical protein
MKNTLMRSLVFITLGIALLVVSTFAPSNSIQTWASFAFGLSFPLFTLGIIELTKRFKLQPIRVKK